MTTFVFEAKNAVRAASLPVLMAASLVLPANAPAQQQTQERQQQERQEPSQPPAQRAQPPAPPPQQRAQQPQQRQQSEQAQQRAQQRRDGGRDFRESYEDRLEDYIVVGMAEYNNLVPNVKVTVNDRTAVLSGRVPTERAKLRAARVALSSRYIVNVQNNIQVDPGMKKTFDELGRTVNEEQLARNVAQRIAARIEGAKAGEDWWFDGWRVEGAYGRWTLVVEPEEYGGVTLEGELPSLEIMRAAVEAAAAVPGVRRINTNFDRQDYYGYGYDGYHNGYGYGRGYGPYVGPYRGPYDGYAYPYAYGYNPYYAYAW